MKNARTCARLILLSSAFFLCFFGIQMQRNAPFAMLDFKALYVGSRCLLHHCDPYNQTALGSFYLSDREAHPYPFNSPVSRRLVTLYVNLPTTFLFTAAFGMLPWSTAHVLWTVLTLASFLTAALLIQAAGQTSASKMSACLVGFIVANSEVLFVGGNAAGLVVSLCIIAAWCFTKRQYEWVGICCIAASLLVKPHDSGLVWLYFLIAGGAYRRRAVRGLAMVVALGLPVITWVWCIAPGWFHEWTSNLAAISSRGGFNDPGPASFVARTAGDVIDLQALISIFRDNPHIYNPASYLVCGVLLLIWGNTVLRAPASERSAWFALAVIAPVTMLITYHKPVDAKLLLLSVPACANLWAEGGMIRFLSCAVTSLAVTLTSDIPLALLTYLTRTFQFDASLSGAIRTVLWTRPAPLVLLAMAIFYLVIFISETKDKTAITNRRQTPSTSDISPSNS